ncbi:hypothetical protein QF001_004740 [Paraburkholderia youngii]
MASALGVAALVAASMAAVVWGLAGRAEVARFKAAVSEG